MAPHYVNTESVNNNNNNNKNDATSTIGESPVAAPLKTGGSRVSKLMNTHSRRRAVSGNLSRKEKRWDLMLSKVPQPESHFEPAPFRVKDYLVVERLGAGSGGRVYLGRHVQTGERVAIKVIEKSDARKEHKARKEAGVMRVLGDQHKNVVPLIDLIENDGSICIIMGHAEGGDLFEYIGEHGVMEDAHAWKIFGQICSAVAHSHSCGFIHRDIKPENIFLNADGSAMLGDWGYACAWSSFKKKSRPCGSLNYAASEIVSNKSYTGPEVDIFSLGGLLYTMLTGRLPFGSTVNKATLQRVIAGKWRVDGCLTPDVVDLLNRMFDPVPIRRANMMDVLQFIKNKQQQLADLASPVINRDVRAMSIDSYDVEVLKDVAESNKESNDDNNSSNKENVQKDLWNAIAAEKLCIRSSGATTSVKASNCAEEMQRVEQANQQCRSLVPPLAV